MIPCTKKFSLVQNQQLNSSTAQQLNSRIASLLVIASMTAAVTGCEGMILGGKTGQAVVKSSATRTEVDAGIILADRESYLCLSFERLGLAEGDVVMSVNSSCECVQPSVVCYRSHQGREANAVLLQFKRKPEGYGKNRTKAVGCFRRDSGLPRCSHRHEVG